MSVYFDVQTERLGVLLATIFGQGVLSVTMGLPCKRLGATNSQHPKYVDVTSTLHKACGDV